MIACLEEKNTFEQALKIYRYAVKQAPFYQDMFAGMADPDSPERWRQLPVMEKQDLYDHAYPRSTAMLTGPVENMIVASTGGTTGVARYTLLTHEEWDAFCEIQAETLVMMGVKRDDRVANLFVAGHLWPSFLGAHEIIKRIGAVHVPISANIAHDEIVRLCVEFDVTVLFSLPTLFVLMADIMKKEGLALPSLRLIAYAGEHMSEEAQKYVRQSLNVEEIKPLAYTSSDAGLMGYPCDRCGFGVYHVPTGFQLLEVVNPETGEKAVPGEKGDIIVTNLVRKAMPLLRYRIGDVGSYLPDPCPCGDTNPCFQLHGRAGDDFKIGGAFISMRVFEESVALVSDVASLNYVLTLNDVGNQMEIILTVEAPDPVKAAEQAGGKLREELINRVNEFKQGLTINFIKRFDIQFVELGSLPRSPITGKVKRLNDKRVVKTEE